MSKNLGLELLRGLCACAVAIYHFFYWHENYLITSMGTFGVYVFFILSALVMMIRYSDFFSRGILKNNLQSFFVSRIARIVPLLSAISIISYYYYGEGLHLIAKAFLTGSGLMFLGLPGSYSIATGAWSLGIEFTFYTVFPIIAALAPRLRDVLVATLVLVIAQQASLALVPKDGAMTWTSYTVPLTFAPYFAMGIIVFKSRIAAKVNYFYYGISVLLIVLLFSFLRPVEVYNGGKTYVFLMFLSGLSVWMFYVATIPAQLLGISLFLGKISYSLYLTHWIAYELSQLILSSIGVDSTFVSAALFATTAIPMAYFIYVLFERPMQNLLLKMLGPAKGVSP